MNKKILLLLSLLISLSIPFCLSAERVKEPFLVHSQSKKHKKNLSVRRNFQKYFTANLSKAERNSLRNQHVRFEKVKLFYYARPEKCSPWPECRDQSDPEPTPEPTPTPNPGSRVEFPDSQLPWGIQAMYKDDASLLTTQGGAGVTVAVLDSGVDADHPDLSQRLTACVDFTGGKPGSIKVGRCDDGDGHGTHVSGTILADGGADGQGIYGVSPQASLMALKVCKTNGCWGDDIAAAIDYAATHGAQIVSMSLGGDAESTLIRDAINRNTESVLVVAAAGNDGPDEGSIDFPGANPNAIAVAALDETLTAAPWSSRGINDGDGIIESREVECAAPGVNVESTFLNGSYAYLSGTSMATPHISGLAAKLWQGSPATTRSHLQSLASLHDLGVPGDDIVYGLGFPQVP